MQINVTFDSLEEMFSFSGEIRGMGDPGLKAFITDKPDKMRQSSGSLAAKSKPAPEKKKDTPVKEDPIAEETETVQEEPAVEEPGEAVSYTLVDVRGKLAALNKAGKKAQVQELIKSFGVEKLSQIPEERYPEVMQKAGEL